ncbi:MAG: recombinase RecA [Candidatus Liptonbacteria bacterium GWC1_60_9]|uniref:Protein RecA n=3 Tax=Candidatus Liptoniibacteriota TaxID=1817909 RepID=A0A1G2CL54_9BACT|nr:MAG: Protein RecA [Parcubacteria group bacterium GW2011_GWA1_60_11]OGY97370.1 MAG: recombinase RecA [Candidatus Liptonbacteria bacterium GWC1_60_9]OGY98005.1 MAG: recombinase RecA [Candidatus Liptonbacteria bacterium RIFCSPHIGHO2_12_FULL_60_13]OGZ02115.1 MAG: recombinase RecA [Candidatus Liptonbacteria bacterium RIFCSPLOWO2_12_FULL_60_15]
MAKEKEVKKSGTEELDSLLASLQEKFGEGAIMKLGEAPRVDVAVIPTGSFSLDLALGVGGLPQGRIVEIFGPESSGKTTLALNVVAQAQKKGGKAAFIDAEHAMDPEYAKKLGVKVNELLISQPDNGEEALNILESLVRSGIIDVIVVDSVAALTPKAEIEGEMGAIHMGLQARMMSQALRKLTAISAKSNTLVVFINQLREKIGIMFGNPETTPGGRALKFYSSVRIDVRRIAQVKKGENIVGNRVRAKVVKNKIAAPFKAAEFDILFGEGISYEGDVLSAALAHGVVTKSGASYSMEGERLGVGFDAVKEKLKEDKKLLQEMKQKVKGVAK